jgi:hypothetical protein
MRGYYPDGIAGGQMAWINYWALFYQHHKIASWHDLANADSGSQFQCLCSNCLTPARA